MFLPAEATKRLNSYKVQTNDIIVTEENSFRSHCSFLRFLFCCAFSLPHLLEDQLWCDERSMRRKKFRSDIYSVIALFLIFAGQLLYS